MGEAGTRRTVETGVFANWVNNVMTWELDSDNTNTSLLLRGGIGVYLAGAAGVYRCPADRAVSAIQRDHGWTRRVRSISLNMMVGYAGEFLAGGVNTNNPAYRQFFRMGEIREPSTIFTFLEEHPDSINDGYFLNRFGQLRWIDLPASYHSGGGNFAFADGHVQRREWLHPATRPPPSPGAAGLPSRSPPTRAQITNG
jgi:prepilin-type processing-associated H-X9-DG protein